MSSFDDMIAAHARGIVASTGHRGESITYKFAAGGARTFSALVIRPSLESAAPGVSRVTRRRAVLVIPKHGTDGVDEVDFDDTIELAIEKQGGDVVECSIREVVLRTGGSFHVEVQAP